MVQDSPSRRQDQFVLRLPDGMRDRLKSEADANKRSMNAEIVARISQTFNSDNVSELSSAVTEQIVRQSVATSLYHVTRSMAAIVEDGKRLDGTKHSVDYVGLIRQMADEFKDLYEAEVTLPNGEQGSKSPSRD